MCILYSESVVVLFLSASIASESPHELEVLCVVLGVGMISVFDAVAFLACAHRVLFSAKKSFPLPSAWEYFHCGAKGVGERHMASALGLTSTCEFSSSSLCVTSLY